MRAARAPTFRSTEPAPNVISSCSTFRRETWDASEPSPPHYSYSNKIPKPYRTHLRGRTARSGLSGHIIELLSAIVDLDPTSPRPAVVPVPQQASKSRTGLLLYLSLPALCSSCRPAATHAQRYLSWRLQVSCPEPNRLRHIGGVFSSYALCHY